VNTVFEARVPESRAFAAAFARGAQLECRLDDVSVLCTAIKARLEAGERIFGCTREASRFVIAGMLRGTGFNVITLGVHRRGTSSRWRHEVSVAGVGELTALFAARDWPTRFARVVTNGEVPRRESFECCEVSSSASVLSPGYVTTWRIA
jgi:hypothetical protein